MAQSSYERLVVVWHPVSASQTELTLSSSFIFSIHFLRCGSDALFRDAFTQRAAVFLGFNHLFHFLKERPAISIT